MAYEGRSTLRLAYVANNGSRKILTTSSRDGIAWTPSSVLSGESPKGTPALAESNLVFVAPVENVLRVKLSLGDTKPISGQSSAFSPAITDVEPLVAYVANNANHDLLTTSYSSTLVGTTWVDKWSPSARVSGQSTADAPALTRFGDRHIIAYVANNQFRTLLVTLRTAGQWSPSIVIGPGSKFSPAITVHQNRLYVAYVANDASNALYVTSSADGLTWTPPTRVSGQSAIAGPAIASARSEIVIAYVANNDLRDLLTTASTNGADWTASRPIHNQQSGAGVSMYFQYQGSIS